jgi:class 3 adenylate cyclase
MARDTSVEAWAKAGLYDPDHPQADLRRRLIAYFDEVGLTPGDFPGETIDSDLGFLANRMLNRPGQEFTRHDARKASGLTPELFDTVASVIGYPAGNAPVFTQADLDTLAVFRVATETFSEAELLHFVRVISASLARVAEAAIALFHIDFGPQVSAADDSEIEIMRKNREAAVLLEMLNGPLITTFALQLQLATERSDMTREFGNAKVEMAVGFVDLVGFTSLTANASLDEVTDLIRRFEALAYDIVQDNGGQVVKLIGDEVMFVAVDPDAACAVATALVDAFSDSVATPRAGLAYGDLVTFGGDFYGPIVNLASRVSDQADASEVLATEQLAVATAHHGFERHSDAVLKGFPDTTPIFRLVELPRQRRRDRQR